MHPGVPARVGVADTVTIGDPVDLSCGPPVRAVGRIRVRAAAAARLAGGRAQRVRARVGHPRADGALKDRGNYELYDDSTLGPFPSDWYAREGRVVLTGEYGGKAGFRHVLSGLGVAVADGEEDLVFSLVQLCAAADGKPLTDDELRLIAGLPHQLALLFPRATPDTIASAQPTHGSGSLHRRVCRLPHPHPPERGGVLVGTRQGPDRNEAESW